MGNKAKKTDVDKRGMIWTEHWDDVLIEALVHQQSMGNRVDKVFTTAAYDNVVKELREKIGEPFEKGHLKNRLKTLKHKFNECHDIFSGMSDFIWSPNTKMWNAQPEVWKALIKVRPDARKWIFTPIANYNKLVMLFGKEKSDCVYDTKEEAHQWVNLGNLSKFNCVDHVMSHNEVTLTPADLNGMKDGNDHQLPTSVEAKSQIDSQAPSQSVTSLNGRKRKAPRNFDFSREFASIREAIKDVAAAIREGNAITERGRPRVYSEQEVFAELVNTGVDSQLRYRAYTFLISNVGRVRAFFGCPSEERKDFLLQMMYSPHDC